MAASGSLAAGADRHPLLHGPGAARPRQGCSIRSSSPITLAVGEDVPRAPRTWLEPITLLAAVAAVTEHDRADCHRVHHLQRALQPGPPVCLPGPHQRRQDRLERGHLRRRRRASNFLRTGPAHARATSGPRNSSVAHGSGTAGRTAPPSQGDNGSSRAGRQGPPGQPRRRASRSGPLDAPTCRRATR